MTNKYSKYLLISILLIFQGLTANAQNDSLSTHLVFKKTEIKGSSKSFIAQLEATGMRRATVDRVRGLFAGYEVVANLGLTPLSNTVYCVDTYFPAEALWDNTYDTFTLLREKITEKYGKPEKSVDKFDHPFSRGDGYTLKALKEKKAHFECTWMLDNGSIYLSIIPASVPKAEGMTQIVLSYTDRQGLELQLKEKDTIIKNDL